MSVVYYFDTSNTSIGAVVLTVVGLYHGVKHYQDFYTLERKPVGNRKKKPEINRGYTLVAWSTTLTIIFSLIYIYATWYSFYMTNDLLSCKIAISVAFPSYGIAKVFTYCTFALRLHLVYNGSQYAIKKWHLLFASGFALLFYVILSVYLVISMFIGDTASYSENNGIITCDVLPDEWFNPTLGMFEIFTNLLYSVLFIKPIRAVIRNVYGSERRIKEEKSKVTIKMLRVGIKVAILTTVLIISTLLANITVAGAFSASFAPMLFPIDLTLNALCLVLMTPYYPDAKFYHILCMSCIFCCDWNGYSKGTNKEAKLSAARSSSDNDDDKQPEQSEKSLASAQTRTVSGDADIDSNTSLVAVSSGSSGDSGINISETQSMNTMSAVRVAANNAKRK